MEDLSHILPSGSPVTVLRDTYFFTFLGCSSKEFVYTYISCMYSGASFKKNVHIYTLFCLLFLKLSSIASTLVSTSTYPPTTFFKK